MSGSSGSAMREKVRALDFDNSVNTVVTLDSLASVDTFLFILAATED